MLQIPLMTEPEFQEALSERKKEQLPQAHKYGMDGYIMIGKIDVKYRGIPYHVALLRYYSLNREGAKLNDAGIHAVVEHPDVDKRILEIVSEIEPYREFLFKDTLHSGQEHYTVEQHIQTAQDEAERDIDWFLDKAIPEFKAIIEQKKQTLKELETLIRGLS